MLGLLASVLLAQGPMVLPSPDLRALSAGPMVSQSRDTATTCTFRPGFAACSDGRTITTTRTSAVPCETSPGVWTYAPAGTACVSVRGLESWGANTTLIAQGHRLDQGPWASAGAATPTLEQIEDGWRLTYTTGFGGRAQSVAAPASSETRTTACLMRAGTLASGRLYVASTKSSDVALGSAYRTESYSATVVSGDSAGPRAYVMSAGYLDIAACWHVAASTPGRPCWQASGAAPFTCAADVHTISTTGWPTTEGSIRIAFSVATVPTITATILDGRTAIGTGQALYLDTSSRLVWVSSGGAIFTGPVAALGDHVAEVRRAGGTDTVLLDGVAVGSIPAAPNWTWKAASVLGSGFAATGTNPFNGSIRSLSWRAP